LINKLLCTEPAELTALVNELGYKFIAMESLTEEDIYAYNVRFDGLSALIIETLKEYEKDIVSIDYLITTLKFIRNTIKMDINKFKKEFIKRTRKSLIENLDNLEDKEDNSFYIKIIKRSTFMDLLYILMNNNCEGIKLI
jgi:hypothetical protein